MSSYAVSHTGALAVIEAAHHAPHEVWADEVSHALTRASAGAWTEAAILQLDAESGGLRHLRPTSGELEGLIRLGQASLSSEQTGAVYAERATASTAAEVFRGGPAPEFDAAMAELGLTDFVGLSSPLPRRGFLTFGAGLTTHRGLSDVGRRRLAGLALHLGRVWDARQALIDGLEPIEARRGTECAARIDRWQRALDRTGRRGAEASINEALNLWESFLREGWVVMRSEPLGGRRIVLLRVPRQADATSFRLTPREREVVQRVARAMMNKEIAFELEIPEATVAWTLHQAQRKLGVRSRLELVHLHRWLEPISS